MCCTLLLLLLLLLRGCTRFFLTAWLVLTCICLLLLLRDDDNDVVSSLSRLVGPLSDMKLLCCIWNNKLAIEGSFFLFCSYLFATNESVDANKMRLKSIGKSSNKDTGGIVVIDWLKIITSLRSSFFLFLINLWNVADRDPDQTCTPSQFSQKEAGNHNTVYPLWLMLWCFIDWCFECSLLLVIVLMLVFECIENDIMHIIN